MQYLKNLMTKERRKRILEVGGLATGIAAIMTTIFTFAINYKKEARIDYHHLLDRQLVQIEKLEARVSDLELENIQLKAKIEIFSSVNHEDPMPFWIKDVNGRMINLNPAYEKLFLLPNGKTKEDYIGRTDMQFWGELGAIDLGEKYRRHDLDVMASRAAKEYIEFVFIDGTRKKLIVHKYPYWSQAAPWEERQLIGIAGRAVFARCD